MIGKGVEVRLGFSIFCGKNYEIKVQRITLLARWHQFRLVWVKPHLV